MQIGSSRYDLQLGCLFYGCAGSIYKISTRKGFSFFLNFDLFSQSDRSELPVSPETEPTKWSSMAVFADSVPDSSFLNSHLFLDVVGKLGEMIYRKTIIKKHQHHRFSERQHRRVQRSDVLEGFHPVQQRSVYRGALCCPQCGYECII